MNCNNISQIKEFLDDFMINSYFLNLKSFEEKDQNEINVLRFKMNQAFYSKDVNQKVGEYYKKQLEEKEDKFFYNIAIKFSELRKCSIAGLILIENTNMNIYSEEFNNYIIESEIEDKNLLYFLEN